MNPSRPIFLFTDFGWSGPYVGQMVGAIVSADPLARVFNLMHDAPQVRPDLAAYLLPACCRALPQDAVVAAVVDPGVGGDRAALIVETATMTFVGPDNGLLSRLPKIRWVARIDWRPASLSASFHGRDLFAPVAARLALGVAGQVARQQRPRSHQAHVTAQYVPQLRQLVEAHGQGLLHEDVLAGLQGRNDEPGVGVVTGADHDHVDLGILEDGVHLGGVHFEPEALGHVGAGTALGRDDRP